MRIGFTIDLVAINNFSGPPAAVTDVWATTVWASGVWDVDVWFGIV